MENSRKKIAAVLLVLCCLPARPLPAQSLPFEDKAKYERALEQKVDEVLVRLLGPNQAKVVVEADMDFTRTEKLEMSSEASPDKNNPFKWQGAGGDAQAGDYLLPGFPAYSVGGGDTKSYNRQLMFPSAFVKRMSVSIIVNRALADQDAETIRRVVPEMLNMDVKRGDQLSVIKAQFAPLWRTIWYTPEALSMVLKYVMFSLMGIIGMIVVSVGFLKLAGAMNTMAKVQQSHQITMDLGNSAVPGGAESGLPALTGPEAAPKKEKDTGAGPGEGEKVEFNVRPDQVPFLLNLMIGEDPANVALVAEHLAPEVRSEFLKRLPPPFASEVIINMSKIRFVEAEIIATLKDELERRLSGAVGGVEGVLGAIEGLGLRAKRTMLSELEQKHPELAAQVRQHVFLPDDLALLSEKDLSLLVSAVKVEEWGPALLELPENVRTKVRSQMADKTWQMIEQSMSYSAPSAEKIDAAIEGIMEKVAGLIKDGRIANPVAGARLLPGGEPAAA